MNIRTMTISDYDAVYSLWMSCAGMGLNDIDDSRDGIEKYLERNPNTSFVAEENGKIIGAIMSGHDGRRGQIYHTAVLSEHRGKGIGSTLTEKAMEALKAEGITKVMLVVFKKNKSGNAFWEKNGFTGRNDLVYRNKALTEIKRIDT